MSYEIIDTFPEFLGWWEQYKDASLKDQLESWSSVYMAAWPDMRQKQIEQYTSEGSDWQQVAAEHVFPQLGGRLEAMREGHTNLLNELQPVLSLASQRLGEFQLQTVIVYVGLGLGAGWVTDYQGKAALLFGLENIAEEGWQGAESLRGLIAHELGHLVHEQWRSQAGLNFGEGPLWQLYSEGFAQRCEQYVLGNESWHMNSTDAAEDWLAWCQNHRDWLAEEFLRRIDHEGDISPFFGSWHSIQDRKQTGYFLGRELVHQMEIGRTLQEIACLEEVPELMRTGLMGLAGSADQD